MFKCEICNYPGQQIRNNKGQAIDAVLCRVCVVKYFDKYINTNTMATVLVAESVVKDAINFWQEFTAKTLKLRK